MHAAGRSWLSPTGERLPVGNQKESDMHRSLFASVLGRSEILSVPAVSPAARRSLRMLAAMRSLDQTWVQRMIYLAAASQAANLLLATYATQRLGYSDFLLQCFDNWWLALFVKALALGLWLIYREFLEARVAALLITPLSLLALAHDVLLLA